ncbi:MAG TPA: DUF2339 domain-containing protein, partial [Thermoleophilaceae bacterium]|nr:DUF2339 domain-containing protein [Thermoleophilaceae bacterium]
MVSSKETRMDPKTASPGARIEQLDVELRALSERVALLERQRVNRAYDEQPVNRGADRAGGGEPDRARRAERGVCGTRTDRTRPQRRAALEDWLGNRALGLAGGVAVLLGVAFLVATAVERGWLDQNARVLVGFGGSALLVLAGCWLHERRGRTQAARAAASAGIAGMFASLIAATRLYDLVPLTIGLAAAVGIGAIGVTLAVRWDSRTVASLGILGAITAPLLVGADSAGATIALTLVTLGAGTAVVVWRRWPGIALAAFGVALPQVGAWVATNPPAVALVAGLAVTWGLGTAAALGIAARSGHEIPVRAMVLLAGTAVFAIAAGNLGLRALGHESAGSIWTVAVALGQVLAGAAALRWTPLQRDLATLSFGASIAAADLALGLLADGATVT